MALPITVATSVSRPCGPFKSSAGRFYALVCGGNTLSAHKATDPTSSFTTAGSVTVTNAGVIRAEAYQVGDDIHVVTSVQQSGGNAWIYYHKYSMSSDSWTVTNEAVKGSHTPDLGDTGYPSNVGIVVRSNGDIVVLYNGASAASMGSPYPRVFLARKVGSTWTIDVGVDAASGAQYGFASTAVLGASDRTHLFFGLDTTLKGRVFKSDNTLETSAASGPSLPQTVHPRYVYTQGTAYVSSGTTKVRVPITGASGSVFSVKLDSADTTTLTSDSGIATGETDAGMGSFAADGTTLYHVFGDGSPGYAVKYQSNANDAGWSSESSSVGTYAWSSPPPTIQSKTYTRGSLTVLAYLYPVQSTGIDVVYNEVTLSGGGPTTHTTTGALSSASSVLSGTSSSATTRSSSGTLAAVAGTLAGTANRTKVHAVSGALAGTGHLLSGTAERFRAHDTSGTPTGTDAILAGTSSSATTRTSSGALTAGTGTIAGTASSATTRTSTGALTAGTGTLAGTAARSTVVTHTTSGALVGVTTLAGTANRFRAHATSGALTGPGSAIVGAAKWTPDFLNIRQSIINNLVSAQSEAAGWNAQRVNIPVTAVVRTSDTVVTITLPALASYSITANETITATVPALALAGTQTALTAEPTFTITEGGAAVTHTTSGVLTAGTGALAGTATRFRAHATTGALAGVPVLTGTASSATIRTATGDLVAGAGVLAGAATRFRAHATSGTLAASGAQLAGDASRSAGAVTHPTSGALVGVTTLSGTANRTRTHSSAGDLASSGASLSGDASSATTRTATGALVAGTGTLAGVASSATVRTATGVLVGVTSLAGTATRFRAHAAAGVLAGAGASITGEASRTRVHASSGALASLGAALAGTATYNAAHATTGALVGVTALTGSATRYRVHDTAGTLAASGATLAGAANRSSAGFAAVRQAIIDGLVSAQSEANGWNAQRVNIPVTAVVRTSDTVVTITLPALPNYNITALETITATVPDVAVVGVGSIVATPTFTVDLRNHATTGALTAGTGAVAGAASRTRVHATTGALSNTATLAGTAARTRVHTTTGTMQAAGATLAGAADSKTTRTATGALQAQAALLSGAASRTRIHTVDGALVAGTGTTSGTSARASGKVATGSLAGAGASIAGSANRIRVHDAAGTLGGTGAAVDGTAQHRAKHETSGALAGVGALTGTAARTREHAVLGVLSAGSALLVASAARTRVHEATGTLIGVGALVGTATLLARIQGTLAATEIGMDVFSSRRDLKRQMFAFFH